MNIYIYIYADDVSGRTYSQFVFNYFSTIPTMYSWGMHLVLKFTLLSMYYDVCGDYGI